MYKAASGTRFVLWEIDRGSEQQNSIKPHSKKKNIEESDYSDYLR